MGQGVEIEGAAGCHLDSMLGRTDKWTVNLRNNLTRFPGRVPLQVIRVPQSRAKRPRQGDPVLCLLLRAPQVNVKFVMYVHFLCIAMRSRIPGLAVIKRLNNFHAVEIVF